MAETPGTNPSRAAEPLPALKGPHRFRRWPGPGGTLIRIAFIIAESLRFGDRGIALVQPSLQRGPGGDVQLRSRTTGAVRLQGAVCLEHHNSGLEDHAPAVLGRQRVALTLAGMFLPPDQVLGRSPETK